MKYKIKRTNHELILVVVGYNRNLKKTFRLLLNALSK